MRAGELRLLEIAERRTSDSGFLNKKECNSSAV